MYGKIKTKLIASQGSTNINETVNLKSNNELIFIKNIYFKNVIK